MFIHHNGLPERWRGRERFTIGETGFGSGLNLLATWQLWRQTASPGQRLCFHSLERYPFSRADLARALARWPEFAWEGERLLAAYPQLEPGSHRLELEGGVELWLHFGDALAMSRQLDFQADAWYLDGFDPAKNPEMWQPPLLEQLARLSAPEATLATFTVAGWVRRGLEATGFELQKVKGHGRKRQMLTGKIAAARENG